MAHCIIHLVCLFGMFTVMVAAKAITHKCMHVCMCVHNKGRVVHGYGPHHKFCHTGMVGMGSVGFANPQQHHTHHRLPVGLSHPFPHLHTLSCTVSHTLQQ